MEKSWNQIAKRWRKNFVNKLQERYGLAEQEARKKADAWLQWLSNQPSVQPQTPAGKIRGHRTPSPALFGEVEIKARCKSSNTEISSVTET